SFFVCCFLFNGFACCFLTLSRRFLFRHGFFSLHRFSSRFFGRCFFRGDGLLSGYFFCFLFHGSPRCYLLCFRSLGSNTCFFFLFYSQLVLCKDPAHLCQHTQEAVHQLTIVPDCS